MRTVAKIVIAAAILIFSSPTFTASAQGPIQKRINFWINVPFEIKNSNAVFPAGQYVLFQISQSQPTIFALYYGDMMHAPVAMINTVRIDYSSRRYPEKTKIMLGSDERRDESYPIIRGFTIPGEDGFDMVSSVSSNKRILASMPMATKNGRRTVVVRY